MTNHATDSVVVTAVIAGSEDVDGVVAVANAAFREEWSAFTGLQRKNCIMKLADLIEKRIPELARADTLAMDLPITLLRHHLYPWAVDTVRANAGYSDKIAGASFTDQDDGFYKVQYPIPTPH